MLLNLHVKNLAIIDEIDVEFGEHFNVLTGETGAGKSIILGSINMALGAKVSKDMVRQGADYALVELVFSLEKESQYEKVKELDLPIEDGQLIISRKIVGGRSVSRVNGEQVTVALLKELAGVLIDIHGQHEHQTLLYKSKHLEILDRFAGSSLANLKEEIGEQYKSYKETLEKLSHYDKPEEERLRELSFMEYEYKEIMDAKLQPGEEDELAERYKKLSHAEVIAEGLGSVYGFMMEDEQSIGELLGRSVRQLAKLTEYDESLEEIYGQLEQLESLALDASREIQSYMEDKEDFAEELADVQARLDLVRGIKARFGKHTKDVMEYAKSLEEKIERYKNYDEEQQKILREKKTCEKELDRLCEKLTKLRKAASLELHKKIVAAMTDLNFPDVQFETRFTKLDDYTAAGWDEAEFYISTNPGVEVKPLSLAASGGELSRIMLAFKAVLAKEDEIPTLIFDEIDTGISGVTAQKVSEKMAYISKEHQVICITHLAQITAMADTHFLIEKSVCKDRTATVIRPLEEEETIQELARIAGGAQITRSVLTSAKEMREMAKEYKKN